MERICIELTSEEYKRLNLMYPESNDSGLIGKRAEEIVKIYFRRKDPRCAFDIPAAGADLKVVFCDGSASLMIEVKGTASLGVAWQQLKVSSQNSWRLLVEERIPVYRVSDVFGRSSTLYVLLYGQDFFLEQEARWTFKLMRNAIDRTPSIVKSKGNLEVRVSNERVKGSKYDALREYLKSKSADEVTLQFKDAAEVLGFPLPSSAYKYQPICVYLS
jgi:hypothetical protein